MSSWLSLGFTRGKLGGINSDPGQTKGQTQDLLGVPEKSHFRHQQLSQEDILSLRSDTSSYLCTLGGWESALGIITNVLSHTSGDTFERSWRGVQRVSPFNIAVAYTTSLTAGRGEWEQREARGEWRRRVGISLMWHHRSPVKREGKRGVGMEVKSASGAHTHAAREKYKYMHAAATGQTDLCTPQLRMCRGGIRSRCRRIVDIHLAPPPPFPPHIQLTTTPPPPLPQCRTTNSSSSAYKISGRTAVICTTLHVPSANPEVIIDGGSGSGSVSSTDEDVMGQMGEVFSANATWCKFGVESLDSVKPRNSGADGGKRKRDPVWSDYVTLNGGTVQMAATAVSLLKGLRIQARK
ncbi:hypothetical protein B0H16DRAFT_1467177 [Mycena metata]|uniref:Uncharacterized protein n=1 Tax=Mycena metata TaxID=1033252 RepID=A0AAD7I5C6_9AGAR|nr:hypothetical protein B0H16DRAFT_1467177 [Mycena metata]